MLSIYWTDIFITVLHFLSSNQLSNRRSEMIVCKPANPFKDGKNRKENTNTLGAQGSANPLSGPLPA
ncbi:hypothetical protein GDO81_017241 [Engystomops pustulosus]|uniref:Uncharacterized protein n=1 Tax=Engystomops pustulosus TaxID=76066 RepID=A0AAV7AGQ0_ENGPU|nr:hypothetical protein GDO81_017241 [Engystomops pustulosus]